MSGCFNKVVIIGRLGNDPDLKSTRSGTSVCNLSVATERNVKQGDKWESKVVWVRVTVWGRRGETVERYLGKGSKLLVEGELDLNEWEDRDGNKKSTLQVIASNVVFLDSKGGRGGGGSRDNQGSGGGRYNQDYGGQGSNGGGLDDSEIPF
jgi:single-strand DNA-binding protein